MQNAHQSSAPVGYLELLERAARIEERLDDGDLDSTEEHPAITTEEASRILQEHRS